MPPEPVADPTRRKIAEAAAAIFSEQGFQAATVRDICSRAGANVAAVNYHFGDKAGLYLEVLRTTACIAHAETAAAATRNTAPAQKLRDIISGLCHGMLAGDRPATAFRLMAHEMSNPTPALDRVIEEVISPNYLHLRNTVGELLKLPADHQTTRLCAHSVIAQIQHYKTSAPVIGRLWPALSMSKDDIDMLADHIYQFSVCSIRNIARKKTHAH